MGCTAATLKNKVIIVLETELLVTTQLISTGSLLIIRSDFRLRDRLYHGCQLSGGHY